MSRDQDFGYILLYGSMRTGGIETLIVRMANALVRNNVPVVVLCEDGALVSSLPDAAQVVLYSGTKDLLAIARAGGIKPSQASSSVLVTFDPISAARGLLLESILPSIGTHLSGVFHPRAYFMAGERRDRILLNRLLASAVGFNQLFFMNEECRKASAEKWSVNLSDCSILPLPVDDSPVTWAPRASKSLRLVSVGRLVDFKAYNLGAPHIVRECLRNGVDVIWDIFGEGPIKSDIQREIALAATDDAVSLRGELPYALFQETVSKYDLFIGIGTAALEAAMAGVPVICCVDSEKRLCYGFIDVLPFGNVGELQVQYPDVSIAGLIANFSNSSETDRALQARACRFAAEKYDMRSFLRTLSDNSGKATTSRKRKKAIGWLYYLMVDSVFARFLRELKSIRR